VKTEARATWLNEGYINTVQMYQGTVLLTFHLLLDWGPFTLKLGRAELTFGLLNTLPHGII